MWWMWVGRSEMMRCQEKKDAAAAMGEKRSKSFFVTPQLLCRMGWMNGGKGGREGNDVAARLAVAGLTIQQATVVHPPGMAWDGLAWGWAARSPFGPDDEYPILDPFSLRNPPRPRPRPPRPRPRPRPHRHRRRRRRRRLPPSRFCVSQHPRRHSCSTTHKRCRIPDLDFQTVGKVLC